MGLSKEEKDTLAALTAKSQEPDEGDDFSVEWWEEDSKGNRRGGALPWSKGKSIYGVHFPDLFGEKPAEGAKGGTSKEGEGKGDGTPKTGTAGKYFGKKDE